jgi:DNA-binding LacI/PurR family transcriptional regulator
VASSDSSSRVSLKSIAKASDHAIATVSYALRENRKIPESTRRKIQAVAANLGYRLNLRVSRLMAYVRDQHQMEDAERLAFVWVHASHAIARANPFLRTVFEGAARRAQETGFGLAEFFTNDAGMTDRRLEQILRARGIVGVVLSPVTTSEATLTLNWDWSFFAPAVIGNVAWRPELHHAGHHHFIGTQTALAELATQGMRRPAAIIEAASTRARNVLGKPHSCINTRRPSGARAPDADSRRASLHDPTAAAIHQRCDEPCRLIDCERHFRHALNIAARRVRTAIHNQGLAGEG